MHFQEMYNTLVLFGTQESPKTKYSVFKKFLLWYKIGFSPLCIECVIRSVAMETRVPIQSGPKPNAVFPHPNNASDKI